MASAPFPPHPAQQKGDGTVKIVTTVTIDGEEVHKSTGKVSDLHQTLANVASQVTSLSRDDQTGVIELGEVEISIKPHGA